MLESTTIDEWHHVLSGDNPADTGTRGIFSEVLKDSSWVIGPSILRTTDWPFIPDERLINKIRLKGPSCDVDNCLETSSSFVTDVTSIKHSEHGFNWEKFSSFTIYKRVIAFRARLLLKDIWKISGQSWDDELPEDIRDKFLEWHFGLPLLVQLTIPRC